jgi:hypothetical protein
MVMIPKRLWNIVNTVHESPEARRKAVLCSSCMFKRLEDMQEHPDIQGILFVDYKAHRTY